ncbi:Exportin-4, partial [Chytridiales sp. JEL 0842]
MKDEISGDGTWTGEAADILLDSWASLSMQAQEMLDFHQSISKAGSTFDVTTLAQFLTSVGYPVFESYVQSRLTLAANELDDEEEEGQGLDDVLMFSDQLIYVSTLARWDPVNCITLLRNLLTERFVRIQETFRKARVNQVQSAEEGHLQITYMEQIHWLVLISGYLLADSGSGEVPVIPRSLMKAS